MTSTRIPVWKSILTSLSADICEGRYGPGDKLPTEAQLSKRFGVNRHTVRRALSELAETGTVYARRGSGVFVSHQETEYPIGRRVRFQRNLHAAGRLASRQALLIETRQADRKEAEVLGLEPGDTVHSYDGLSLADNQPLALFRSVFPAERLPGLVKILQEKSSITESLKATGVLDYTRRWTRISARQATATQALQLRVREGAPLLRTVSLSDDPAGIPIEYGRTWFASEQVTLVLETS